KPSNIHITRDGKVKLLDFGLARLTETPHRSDANSELPTITLSRPGMIVGTAGYMSPEQARGEEADRKSDIWTLGVVIFEMLTGNLVGAHPNWSSLPTKARSLQPILKRCLINNPAERFHDAADVRVLLTDALATDSEWKHQSGAQTLTRRMRLI